MNLARFKSRSPVGLDIGSKSIKAVQLSDRGGDLHIAAAASVSRLAAGPQISEAEVHRIADVLDRLGFTGDEIVLAVPPDKLSSGPLELPPRSAALAIAPLIRNEFCRAQKLEPQTVEIAHWDLPAPARAARGTHVMVAACTHDLASHWVDTFAAVGWDVVGLDVRPLALARGSAASTEAVPGITAIVDLGWRAAALVVLHQGIVVFDRTFEEFGISRLRSDFALQLRMTPELADALLWNRLSPEEISSDGIFTEAEDAIRAHFQALCTEIAASVDYVSKRYPEAAVGRCLLAGGGAALPEVTQYFTASLGVECAAATPLSVASCPAALVASCTPALTLATGLARYSHD